MPKDTFYKLSDEKKRRIFDAAVKEFSTRRFSDASLNQIVKAAKIPWGSFYQYFDGKEDLFRYMFEEIRKEKHEILLHAKGIDPDADVFEVCMKTTMASYEWARLRPDYSKISMLMEIDESEFIKKLNADIAEVLKSLVERDKQRGLIRPEIDTGLVADMIYTFLLKEYFQTGLDEELFTKKLGDAIKIIRKGVATV